MFDMNSMLLAAAISGGFLSVSMLSCWSIQKGASFKLTWSIGVVVLVAHVIAYWFFARDQIMLVGALACMLLPIGTVLLYAAARQFVDEGFAPQALIVRLSLPYLLVVPPVFLAGYDGIALILQNAYTATLLTLAGLIYSKVYREVPFAIGSMTVLYIAAAATFVLCGLVLLVEEQWSIGYPPQNWAEELNVVVSVLAVTGVGALTLSIEQSRVAHRNELSARTDALTGLLNRRGLAAVFPGPLGPDTAVVLFDLDHFKQVNDRYGHAVGDDVIRRFARTLRDQADGDDAGETQHLVRLGGEEFMMVMEGVTPRRARKIAERVGEAFARTEMSAGGGETFCCTVSAGIAFGDPHGADLHDVMSRADRSLYVAKREGRNRVETGEWRLVG